MNQVKIQMDNEKYLRSHPEIKALMSFATRELIKT